MFSRRHVWLLFLVFSIVAFVAEGTIEKSPEEGTMPDEDDEISSRYDRKECSSDEFSQRKPRHSEAQSSVDMTEEPGLTSKVCGYTFDYLEAFAAEEVNVTLILTTSSKIVKEAAQSYLALLKMQCTVRGFVQETVKCTLEDRACPTGTDCVGDDCVCTSGSHYLLHQVSLKVLDTTTFGLEELIAALRKPSTMATKMELGPKCETSDSTITVKKETLKGFISSAKALCTEADALESCFAKKKQDCVPKIIKLIKDSVDMAKIGTQIACSDARSTPCGPAAPCSLGYTCEQFRCTCNDKILIEADEALEAVTRIYSHVVGYVKKYVTKFGGK